MPHTAMGAVLMVHENRDSYLRDEIEMVWIAPHQYVNRPAAIMLGLIFEPQENTMSKKGTKKGKGGGKPC